MNLLTFIKIIGELIQYLRRRRRVWIYVIKKSINPRYSYAGRTKIPVIERSVSKPTIAKLQKTGLTAKEVLLSSRSKVELELNKIADATVECDSEATLWTVRMSNMVIILQFDRNSPQYVYDRTISCRVICWHKGVLFDERCSNFNIDLLTVTVVEMIRRLFYSIINYNFERKEESCGQSQLSFTSLEDTFPTERPLEIGYRGVSLENRLILIHELIPS